MTRSVMRNAICGSRRFAGRLTAAVRAFAADTRGVSTVEYALIIVAVVAIIGVAAASLNDTFTDLFNDLGNQLGDAVDDIDGAVTPAATPATP